MKKRYSAAAVLLIISMLSAFVSVPVSAIEVSAQAAILIEAVSGDVIFEKNAHTRLPMASTTKIMTAITALENADPSSVVCIDAAACGIEGSSIYLTAGEEFTLEELLYAVMLESANDAAAAIAIAVSGSVDAFADLMNETARRIGLSDSHFTNPHGLDDADHYTTAADLARLASYAMQNEHFRKIAATQKYTIPAKNGNTEGCRVLLNHNKLLRMSQDVTGIKTGFTKRSGRCLVSSAERNGVSVIAVTLNAPDDWQDHTALHALGFSSYHAVTLAEPGEFQLEIPCPGSDDGFLTVVNRDRLVRCMKMNASIEHIVECGPLRFPPVDEGEICGTVRFFSGDRELASLPLYAAETVLLKEEPRSAAEKILDIFR